jgi:CDP-glycerol glycerophosphotransferase (TagB/SpsB family)
MVKRWQLETSKLHNVVWDTETFGTNAMQKADILISDTSSIRFDFAFLYNKPVVTLAISHESREEFEVVYLEQSWTEKVATQIGPIVTHETIGQLTEIAKTVRNEFSGATLRELRDATIANFGNSAPSIVAYIFEKMTEVNMSPLEKKIEKEFCEMKQELAELRKEVNMLQTRQKGI